MKNHNLGLAKNRYFINCYTELVSYCSDNYEEVKDLKESKTIFKKGKYYERDKTGEMYYTFSVIQHINE